jgi:hypothetical protein
MKGDLYCAEHEISFPADGRCYYCAQRDLKPDKVFYERPPTSARTWFEFAQLVEGRTVSRPDAYVTGWLDAGQSYERLLGVCLMVAWLASMGRLAQVDSTCEWCEKQRRLWTTMYGPTRVPYPCIITLDTSPPDPDCDWCAMGQPFDEELAMHVAPNPVDGFVPCTSKRGPRVAELQATDPPFVASKDKA